MSLAGKVALVTGASRGIGKGIALQLGAAGATVYITGRTLKGKGEGRGNLEETAEEVSSRGGKCIPVQCDHTSDDDVEKLFKKIELEQQGQLDILVNNAYAAVHAIMENMRVPFWEQQMSMWDTVNNVGLRNHYMCTIHASRMMVPRKQGLIVFISSAGGLRYLFNVPYGVGKAACDRMAVDCAHELKRHKVTCVSLWPGAVKTENIDDFMSGEKASAMRSKDKNLFEEGETIEYAGKCVEHLAADSNKLRKTGRVLLSVDLGEEYGFVDVNGCSPPNMRSIGALLRMSGWNKTAMLFPRWVKLPYWTVALSGSKF